MIYNLSHISLSTNSLEKVKKFYVEILNFKIAHEFINKETNEIYGYFLEVGNSSFIEFFNYKKKIKKKINEPLRHICFDVKNIYKMQKKLSKYINKSSKIKRGKSDKILQFYINDFEGNLIEFHQKDKLSKF